MRALGIGPVGSLMAKGTFGSREAIVVADFTSPANDSTLGVTVSAALRTGLEQSSNLKVVTKASVTEALRLMKRPTDSRVPFDLAREIATRDGAKAVLDGAIVQLGSSYVISARLVGALDGSELAHFRRTTRNTDDLVSALDGLSKDIRSKVGESLRDVRETTPLERVTTASLPALRRICRGHRLIIAASGDNMAGLVPLEEAVALDSTFAMRRGGASRPRTAPGRRAEVAQQQHAITQAFRFRDHLSDDERLLTEAGYYSWGPAPSTATARSKRTRELIARDSTNQPALNDVGNLYFGKRDFAHAEDRYRRATLQAHPYGGAFTNLIRAQIQDDKIAAADSTLQRLEKTFPGHSDLPDDRAEILAARGELQAADSVIRAGMATVKSPGVRSFMAWNVSALETERGHLRERERWAAQTIVAPAGTASASAQRLAVMLDTAWVQAYYLNDAASAHATIRRALAQVPMESLAAADRPWLNLLALAGVMHDGSAARGYDASLEKDLPTTPFAVYVGYRDAARGVLAMAENRPKDAAALFATAYGGDVARQHTGPLRAEAFDLANEPDSAIVEFERFIDTQDPQLNSRQEYLAGSYKRLGELYEAKGNAAKAIENYQKFIDLWKDADPELQPAVRAAKARLDDLKRKGAKG